MTATFKKGDRVHVDLEATVEWADADGFCVEFGKGHRYYLEHGTPGVKPARDYKVGDTIRPSAFDELPVGAVVVFPPGGGANLKTLEGWVGHDWLPGPPDEFVDVDYRIIHIGPYGE